MYTIDASVLVNAANLHEAGHAVSLQVLTLLQNQALPVIQPFLALIEVAAVLNRTRNAPLFAQSVATTLHALPHFVYVSLDEHLTHQAISLAITHHLRGADAVYAAVAVYYSTTLISLDHEHLTRLALIVPTQTPATILATLTSPTPPPTP